MPQLISVPIPYADYTTLKDGENYWSDLDRQFLHAERVPALRRQHHGAGDHGARREANVQ